MPWSRTVAPFVGAIVLAGLLAAGCGDDGGDELTEEEFVEQANEICADLEAEFEEEVEDVIGDEDEFPTGDEVRELADLLVEGVERQADQIDDLVGPASLEEELDDIIDEARAATAELADQLRDDPSTLFDDQEDPFAAINGRLQELGLDECA